jgi:hypothetical protein
VEHENEIIRDEADGHYLASALSVFLYLRFVRS